MLQAELHARDPGPATATAPDRGDLPGRFRPRWPGGEALLAAGDPAAAFHLLSERVVHDFLVNPTVGSALDLDEVQPDAFAGAPEILGPLAVELLTRGAFERGARAFTLAQDSVIDAGRQPELAMKLALVSSHYCALVGQLDESLAHRDRARSLAAQVGGLDDWRLGLDVLAMYCHTYLGQYAQARQTIDAVASGQFSPPPVTEVLCPGVTSQVALAEGALAEAATLANAAQAAARRLGLDRHYMAFSALRTAALLALERGDLAGAAGLNEHILAMLGGGRPVFEYLAQLDRARIWAADGNLDEALSSLPAARTALKSDHSVLFTQADELEARLRLALGDHRGALSVAERRLPDDRRMVVSAIIALGAGDPQSATEALRSAPTADRPPVPTWSCDYSALAPP